MSTVTLPALIVVNPEVVLPATSVAVILIATVPSVSDASTVYADVNDVPGLAPLTVSALVAAAPPLVKVTVGEDTFSFVAIVNVTVSPVLANVTVSLSLAILDVLIVAAV